MEKFLHIHLFISIIFSTLFLVLGNENSFLSLNSTDIMEAKKRFMSFDITKLTHPPMPSYTFAIYNRDLFEKSKFKDYDSLLKNKLARGQARANHLSSVLRNGNVMGVNGTHESKRGVLTTASIFNLAGEYVASFTLGSQGTTSYLLVDTGGNLVWWQCEPCIPNGCYNQRHSPIYNSSVSTTYRKLDCIGERRASCHTSSSVYTCYGDHTCYYDLDYADGARVRGWIAEDVITFALDQSQARILFGCGKDQTSGTSGFTGEYSGIAGIGRRITTGVGYSLPSQFQSNIMAICLPPMYSTQASTLTFHTTPFRAQYSAKLLPNHARPYFYFVDLYKVFINGVEIPFPPSNWDFKDEGKSGGCLVDTGASYTYFPRAYYNMFRDIYRQEAAQDFQRYEAPGDMFDTCYVADPSQVIYFPFVVMSFGSGDSDNMLLLSDQRVVVQVGKAYCLAFMPWDTQTALIGGHQLQGIGLTFDTGADTLSFDINVC